MALKCFVVHVKITCMCLIYEIECLRVITAYLDLFRIPAFGYTQLFSVSILYKMVPHKVSSRKQL